MEGRLDSRPPVMETPIRREQLGEVAMGLRRELAEVLVTDPNFLAAEALASASEDFRVKWSSGDRSFELGGAQVLRELGVQSPELWGVNLKIAPRSVSFSPVPELGDGPRITDANTIAHTMILLSPGRWRSAIIFMSKGGITPIRQFDTQEAATSIRVTIAAIKQSGPTTP